MEIGREEQCYSLQRFAVHLVRKKVITTIKRIMLHPVYKNTFLIENKEGN